MAAGRIDAFGQSCGPAPIVISASPGAVCAGTPVTITITANLLNSSVTVSQGGSSSPQTYPLVAGVATYTFTPAGSTTINITDVSGLLGSCVPAANSTLSVPVSVTSTPPAPSLPLGSTVAYCRNSAAGPLGGLATTNVSGGMLTFYTSATGSQTVPASSIPSTATVGTTTYYVAQKAGPNCEGPRAALTIAILETPNLGIALANPAGICSGTSTTLTASGAAAYSWSIASGPGPLGTATNAAAMTVSPTATTTYTVTGTAANGCTAAASATVNVAPMPGLALAGSSSPASCTTNDGTISFTVTNLPAGTYPVAHTLNGTPQTSTMTVTGSTGTISGLTSGSYADFTVTQGGCTSVPVAGPVQLSSPGLPPTPVATAPATTFCTGETLQLDATGVAGATFAWSGPGGYTATGQTISRSNATAAFSGTYSVSATVNGCTSLPAMVTVLIKPVPHVDPIASQALCSGELFSPISFSGTDQTAFDYSNPDAAVMPIGLSAGATDVQGIGAFIGTNNGNAARSNTIVVRAVNTADNKRCVGDSTAFVLTVNSGPLPPAITTTAPAAPCSGLRFQNFNAAESSTNGTYTWTTTGATSVYAGANSRNALINFTGTGPASVKLTMTTTASGCPGISTWTADVATGAGLQDPQVVLVNDRLVCLLNTVDKYQWGYDDEQRMPHTLTGETGQDYLPASGLQAGRNYWVLTYQGGGGCFRKTYYNAPLTAGSTAAHTSLRLYPNPAASTIYLDGDSRWQGPLHLSIHDASGRMWLQATTSVKHIDISALPAGAYLLRCSNAGEQTAFRFTKQP